MDKGTLNEAVVKRIATTKEVIEDFLGALNSGQRKKILKNEKIRADCILFGVEIEEEE